MTQYDLTVCVRHSLTYHVTLYVVITIPENPKHHIHNDKQTDN